MENIERTQFVVLTGHTQEQPLPDLIRRLRVQRKSGRLQVEYADGPGSFFFEDGQMVDARLGELRGVEALYAALALEGGSFNFNPLVRPPERNIDRQGQQFIRDLVEAPRREGLAEVRVAGGTTPATREHATLPERAPLQLGPGAEELLSPLQDRLLAVEGAIEQTARRFSRERLAYAVLIGFLVGLSMVTTLHVLYGPFFGPRAEPLADRPAVQEQTAAAPRPAPTQSANSNTDASAEAPEPAPPVPAAAAVVGSRRFDGVPAPRREYVVEVLVEVKEGRVTDARVFNPRPGAAPYEAVALKMARERSYPANFTGGERVKIRVKP
ncbi:MAG TPA: DUF4388 domain-containing protein [Pyrinomonadaceae bacterium]|nr:DUF4388 domain-containing protein [Pyrinomonadaceae bacterium]